MREAYPRVTIIAGNVVTGEMVEELILSGADIVKVRSRLLRIQLPPTCYNTSYCSSALVRWASVQGAFAPPASRPASATPSCPRFSSVQMQPMGSAVTWSATAGAPALATLRKPSEPELTSCVPLLYTCTSPPPVSWHSCAASVCRLWRAACSRHTSRAAASWWRRAGSTSSSSTA